jgi:hypothetical protein
VSARSRRRSADPGSVSCLSTLQRAVVAVLVVGAAMAAASLANAQTPGAAPRPDGLLFHLTADSSLTADYAAGQAGPTFADKLALKPSGGAEGGYIEGTDDQALAYRAAGNIYAARGTVAFDWRSRYPVGRNPFPCCSASATPDHSSWDMAFLRVDWNGHGFDAFVTDTGLARTRVSFEMAKPPAAGRTGRIWRFQLGRNGRGGPSVRRRQARGGDKEARAVLRQRPVGPVRHRTAAPSAACRCRAPTISCAAAMYDEIRVYDHALAESEVAGLVSSRTRPLAAASAERHALTLAVRDELAAALRLQSPGRLAALAGGPGHAHPPVEFTDVRDWKARFVEGQSDGMRESTWPGVYNRSRACRAATTISQLPTGTSIPSAARTCDLVPARRAMEPDRDSGRRLRSPFRR